MVCYQCGRIGYLDDGCQFSDDNPSSNNGGCLILPKNLVVVGGEEPSDEPCPLVVEGKATDGGARPKLSLWLVTSSI